MEKMQQKKEWVLLKKLLNNLFDCGVNVITTGNHVWDQKETANILKEKIDF